MGQHANFTQQRPDWPWLCKNPERPRCKVKLREHRLMWLSVALEIYIMLIFPLSMVIKISWLLENFPWNEHMTEVTVLIVQFISPRLPMLLSFFMPLAPDEHTRHQAIILREQKHEKTCNSETANLFEECLCSRCWGSGLFTALVRINKTQYQYNDSPTVWLFSGKGLWDKGPQSAASDRRRQRVSCVPTHKVQAAEGVNRSYGSSAVRLPRHLSLDDALTPASPHTSLATGMW